jgi:hypothetical protein
MRSPKIGLLLLLGAACGGSTPAPAKPAAPEVRAARAAEAIDPDAGYRMGFDYDALRRTGWMDLLNRTLMGHSDFNRWKGLARSCRFEPERDAHRLELSEDDRQEKLFAIEPLKPLEKELDCLRAAVRESFFREDEIDHVGRPDAEVVRGLLLIGSPGALREAKRRLELADDRRSPAEALVWISAEQGEGAEVEIHRVRLAGEASALSLRYEIHHPRGRLPDASAMRARLDQLGASIGEESDAARALGRAIAAASIAVEGSRVVVGVRVDRAPGLVVALSESLDRWLSGDRVSQCNELIEVINREQAPLRQALGSDAEALQKLADTLEAVAVQVDAVAIDDATLVAFRDDYAKMARDLALDSRKTSAAIASNDLVAAADAAKSMSSFTERESDLVDAINRYCSGSP